MIDGVQLRAALGTMCDVPRWFLWRLTPDPKNPGHFRKEPYSHDLAYRIDHLAGQGLLSFDNALQWVNHQNAKLGELYPTQEAVALGFSMSEGCGFWFLDVDNAFKTDYTGQTVFASPQAEYLYNEVVVRCGCAFEVSSSGLGFHAFGAGTLPKHAKRNTGLGLELYTEGRGIAFGLSGQMSGSVHAVDGLRTMSETVAPFYFAYDPSLDAVFNEIDFLSGPIDTTWRGPKDDEELLRRALQSSSVASKFGNAVTFAQLWDNDPACAAGFPGQSETDMALLAHLAFWTGKDPQRMERLAMRSKLVRDKWLERRGELTWLQHSILEQCKKPMKVLQDKEVTQDFGADATEGTQIAAAPIVNAGSAWMTPDQQMEYFAGCTYCADVNMIYDNRGNDAIWYKQDAFNNMKSNGRQFVTDNENGGKTGKAWDCFMNSQAVIFPKVHRAEFDPRMESGMISVSSGGIRTLNMYVKPEIRQVIPQAGEIEERLFGLVSRILPDQNDQAILLYYMAAVVQHQGVKFRWCPILQGAQGNGKSTLCRMVAYCVGEKYCDSVRSKDLTSQFNDWLWGKIFICVDDVHISARDKQAREAIKPMITERRQLIEMKGCNRISRNICANFFMSMNDRAGMPRDDAERRYAIFYTAQQSKADVARDLPKSYFIELNRWLEEEDGFAKIAHWLYNVPIPDEYNPATHCIVAPVTSSEEEILEANKDVLTEALEAGVDTGAPGFCGGFISIKKAVEYLTQWKVTARPSAVRRALKTMGYVAHPSLDSGRTNNPVLAEGERVVLWVKPDHETVRNAANYRNIDIAKIYERENYGNHAVSGPPGGVPPEYENYNL